MLDNFLNPVKIVSADPMTATVASPWIDASRLDNVAFQVNWSNGSSPVGTITLEGSVDGINAVGITLSATLSVSGSSGSILVDANQTSVRYVRCKYNFTSGSGSMDIWADGKDI